MAKLLKRPFRNRADYEAAVRRRVCSRCIDFGADSICHSLDPKGCAIFRFLPELVAIAESLNELKIEPYIAKVRERICMKCRGKNPAAACELRDTVNCGLDRYLALVIEAIEEVEAFRRKRKKAK